MDKKRYKGNLKLFPREKNLMQKKKGREIESAALKGTDERGRQMGYVTWYRFTPSKKKIVPW